jgi:hypothetical protein
MSFYYEICDLQQNASTATQCSDENEWKRPGFHPKSGKEADDAFVAHRKSHNFTFASSSESFNS